MVTPGIDSCISKISLEVTSKSKGVPNFLYPKVVMKGPLNRGGAYINWNGPLFFQLSALVSYVD